MNSFRQTVTNVREDRRLNSIAGARPSIERHWLALAAAMIVVFVSFFAIGRAMHGGGSPAGESPTTLHAAAVKVGIPTGLDSAPPIESNRTLKAIAAESRRVAARPRAPAISIRTALRSSPPAQSTVVEAPARSASEEATPPSAPEPAPVEQAPAKEAPAPSKPSSSSGAGHSGSSSGGGSFDSSG